MKLQSFIWLKTRISRRERAEKRQICVQAEWYGEDSERFSLQLFESQLPDAGNQRAGVDSEQVGGAARAVNPPARLGERGHNVVAFELAQLRVGENLHF